MNLALLYEELSKKRVRCCVCAQSCILDPGQRGFCGVRENREGTLYSLVGTRIAAACADPIEKKPLYHVLPGTRTFSIGTVGCNFDCRFCQNADLSRSPACSGIVGGDPVPARQVIDAAKHAACASVAFTYNEPTVFIEHLCDVADVAQQSGLLRLLVSNGYQSTEALNMLAPRIDAANIDLKAFSDTFYREQCRARLDPVLKNLSHMKALGWWLEITTLIIPGLNDNLAELREAARFICKELGAHVPWHITAFHPCRNVQDKPATPVATLRRVCEMALAEGMQFVYPGNAALSFSTHCPCCGAVYVDRCGRHTRFKGIGTVCSQCRISIPGIWQ